MIYLTIEENAGIGNQLFQYAHGYACAKRYGQQMHIVSYLGRADCAREYMLDRLQLDQTVVKAVTRVDRVNFFKHSRFKGANALNRIYRGLLQRKYAGKIANGAMELRAAQKFQNRIYIPDAPMDSGRDYYIEGFYESYRYFADCAQALRKQFQLKAFPQDPQVQAWLEKMRTGNSVAVHIRMGDFASCNRLFPLDFYEKAMEFVASKIEGAEFYIFSEDMPVKEHFRSKGQDNIHVVTVDVPDKDIVEWGLLSQCRHHIITNSTFSWWSAFAADYDDKQIFIPEKALYLQRENADIFLSEGQKYGDDHYFNYFPPEYQVLPL